MSGLESYPYPVKEGQRYINLNPGRRFVQQPPQRERDREAHLNYYASAYNRKRQLSQRQLHRQKLHCNSHPHSWLLFQGLTSLTVRAYSITESGFGFTPNLVSDSVKKCIRITNPNLDSDSVKPACKIH